MEDARFGDFKPSSSLSGHIQRDYTLQVRWFPYYIEAFPAVLQGVSINWKKCNFTKHAKINVPDCFGVYCFTAGSCYFQSLCQACKTRVDRLSQKAWSPLPALIAKRHKPSSSTPLLRQEAPAASAKTASALSASTLSREPSPQRNKPSSCDILKKEPPFAASAALCGVAPTLSTPS